MRTAPTIDAKECIFNLELATYKIFERKIWDASLISCYFTSSKNNFAAYYTILQPITNVSAAPQNSSATLSK